MSGKTALAVFVKFPEPGQVKTRLAADLGPQLAAQVYRRLVATLVSEILRPLDASEFDIHWWLDPSHSEDQYLEWLELASPKLSVQQGADLGARMHSAFTFLLARYQSAIVIGSDCIALLPDDLYDARRALREGRDLVLGPAIDGGYYLIGMTQAHAGLFEQIPWSSPQVLEQTLERSARLGLSTGLLPTLGDIDTLEDFFGYFS